MEGPELPYTSFEDVYRREKNNVWHMIVRTGLEIDRAERVHGKVFDTMETIVEEGMPKNVPAMLTRLTTREICNAFRIRAREMKHLAWVEDIDGQPDAAPSPEDALIAAEEEALGKEQIERILRAMPARAANRIKQLDLGELVHAELAEAEEIPLATMRSQHQRARRTFFEVAKRLFGVGGGR